MDIVATAQARETGNSPHQLFVTPPRRPDQMIVAQLSYWSVSYRQLATGSLFAYIVHRRNPPTRNVQCNLILVWWSFVNLCIGVVNDRSFSAFFFFFFFSPRIVSSIYRFDRTFQKKEFTSRTRKDWKSSIVALPDSRVRAIFLWYLLWLVISCRCSSSVTTRGRFISKGDPPLRLAGEKEKRISLENQFSLYILPSFFLPKELRSLRNRGQKFFFWSQRI